MASGCCVFMPEIYRPAPGFGDLQVPENTGFISARSCDSHKRRRRPYSRRTHRSPPSIHASTGSPLGLPNPTQVGQVIGVAEPQVVGDDAEVRQVVPDARKRPQV